MTEDEARYEEGMEALYEEHKEIAIEEFIDERLKSYFIANPMIIQKAMKSLDESIKLLENHPTAAYLFATIAIEVGLKSAIIQPFVFGMVHSESAAGIITDMMIKQSGIDRFSKFLFQVVNEFGGIDIQSYKREGKKKALWEEIKEVQKRRNKIVHTAVFTSEDEPKFAINIAVDCRVFIPTKCQAMIPVQDRGRPGSFHYQA